MVLRQDFQQGTALDIGCGSGDSSIYLARHGWQVTGVDFVSAALAKAPKKADGQRVAIDFVQAGSHGCRYAVGRDPATTVLAARRHNYALAWTP